MRKEFKMCPATKFITWLILGLIVCIIGISNVFADTIDFKIYDYQVYYDNFGSSVSAVGESWNSSFNAYVSNNITTSANSYGAGVAINSGIPIISGHTYSLSFYFIEKSNIALSSKNRIALGNSASGAASNYAISDYYTTMITSKVVSNTTLQFAFTANYSGQFIFIPWTTTRTVTQNYVFTDYIINDLGASGGVSQSEINTSLNNQTNILNQSITNSQNAIIENQENNTQAIIDSNRVCTQYDKNAIELDNQYLDDTGGVNNLNGYGISSFISINKNGSLKVLDSRSDSAAFCFYDINKTIISCSLDSSVSSGDTISIPNNASFFRFSILKVQNKPTYEYCANGSQAISDSINDLNDSINNDNVDSSSWSNFFNNFTTNTFGLTSIITAPLNLIQSLTSTSCTDLQLPLPYLQNKYLTLPCMTTIYSQYFGTFFTLYQTITYGIIAYWVCVRIFNLVKDFKNPDHDEIEVVDL